MPGPKQTIHTLLAQFREEASSSRDLGGRCLWFLANHKNADAKRGFRDRRAHTLFIDARTRDPH